MKSKLKRYLAIFGILLSVFINSLTFTAVFPIADRAILSFGLVENQKETKYWAGILGGMIMLGRFISSPFWGMLCDKWGRRPVILTGSLAACVLSILFGLSKTYSWALSIRFLQGLLSPINVSTRSIMSEMYPPEQQSTAMSSLVIFGQLGYVSGVILGEFFENLQHEIELFQIFPFLLPSLIVCLLSIVSFLLCNFFVDETRPKNYNSGRKLRTSIELLMDSTTFTVMLIYCVVSFTTAGMAEVIVHWEWGKKDRFGFELKPHETGTISAITSILLLFYLKSLHMKLSQKYGYVALLKTLIKTAVVFLVFLPGISIANKTHYLKWVFLITGLEIYYALVFMIEINCMVLINNSVLSYERGVFNGICLAFGNLARGVSAPVFGIVFASTASSNNTFPFNFYFSFALVSLILSLNFLNAYNLPISLDKPKTTSPIQDPEASPLVDSSPV